jgi:photosystem II stability/assembly factor-like uncharacterized protein
MAAALATSTCLAGDLSGPVPADYLSALRWRLIGPFRGGRTLAVAGVPGQPETFYFGAVAGGVWKTTDAGRTWVPLFDDQPIASIGALTIAPSDPSVIYVGTGEEALRSDITFGAGVYKSTDAGKSWRLIGLEDSQHIGRILVDPANPDIVLVAALGHAYGPNSERGVFRSTDGGAHWTKVLYKDERTGAINLAADPDNPQTVYAALWDVHRTTWSTYAPVTGPGGGLYRSQDGGLTWTELTGHGLPAGTLGRIGVAVAAGQNGQRVYAMIDSEHDAGLYRSNDGGESWRLVCTDPRIHSRPWYFSKLAVDPQNPDVVYAPNVALYRSTDGGAHFEAIKGAPGGDDYHQLWIDPEHPERMIVGSDQGAAVSVNGGKTWSSWYNQPTAQFYHVATDDSFPYRVYGSQQDSGTAAVLSRSDVGAISLRDWAPVGGQESGYLYPDPDDSNIVYGGGTDGDLFRFDKKTGQSQDITPWPAGSGSDLARRYRFPWTSAMAFSPQRPHALYYAAQVLFRSTDQGHSWTTISPDLTLRTGRSAAVAPGAGEQHAIINTVAPSRLERGLLWVGTDNGLIQITHDEGQTWRDVTPEGLPAWSQISLIEASPHDPVTAYAAVDRHFVDDFEPMILRTRDGGESWTKITTGIPAPAFVRAVREDPARKGLLYAGTELGVYVSFDDGDHWQSLQLNLPVSPIRDLVVHGEDLVVATHGRSFWILDGLTPLRQLEPSVLAAEMQIVRPASAIRVRASLNTDTPLPIETPLGTNPPAGAILDYFLKSVPAGELILEIRDQAGELVRRFSSRDQPESPQDAPAFTSDWFKSPPPPSTRAGLNRFVWDLRYPKPAALQRRYGIAAAYGTDTPRLPQGLLVLPGTYQVTLTVAGQSQAVPLEVKQDPRVEVPPAALSEQLALWNKIAQAMDGSRVAVLRIRELRSDLRDLRQKLGDAESAAEIVTAIDALEARAAQLEGSASWEKSSGFTGLNAGLASLANAIERADASPTEQARAVFAEYERQLGAFLASLAALESSELAALNQSLAQHGLPPLTLAAIPSS